MVATPYERMAGSAAIAVAAGGVAYSILFVIAVKAESSAAMTASWLVLLLGGLLSTTVIVALYQRVQHVDSAIALLALVLGVGGGFGTITHAGYALATTDLTSDLPSQTDPRGLATFGITGLGLIAFSTLIVRSAPGLPRRLGSLGLGFGVLLVLTYMGRLIIVDPNNLLLLGVAGISGLVVHPWWFGWLGRCLRSDL